MKKSFFLVVFLLFSASLFSQSQKNKPFRLHLTPISYVIPKYTQGFSAGVGLSIEPAYAINDELVIGAKIESAIMGIGSDLKDKLSAVGSYTLTADYFLNEGDARFFAGATAGYFRTATTSVSSTNVVFGGSGFGYGPRAGIQFGHLRIAGEYNIVPSNMSYFNLKAAVTIGGGKL